VEWRPWLRTRLVDQIVDRPGLRKAILRQIGSPLLFELYESAASWHTSAESMLPALFDLDAPEAASWVEEAFAASRTALDRVPRSALRHPEHYMVGGDTAALLYCVVRLAQPAVMLETGVADGFSTALILEAMQRNGHGELHSVDQSDDVGMLVTDRARWHLHVTDPAVSDAVVTIVDELPRLDLFFHDGGHDYQQQSLEYRTAWAKLEPGGMVLSDDIEWSFAFLDFIREIDVTAPMMMDTRKVVGAAKRE
jgi:predicted O-methyltransferase YrrM